MEKSSYSEHSRVGFGYRRSFGNPVSSPKISQRNSDIDFHDVFGGPPRTSFTERRESVESNLVRGSEDARTFQNPRSASSEKPVFGGESPRLRHLSNDFFDDIFDSSSSISRKPDRDVFSSLPASRILSPTHPLPPNREPFVGASSLPPSLSLSSKLPKGAYLPMFCTPHHSPIRKKDIGSNGIGYSSSPIIGGSRHPFWTVEGQDELRNDIQPSYRQSHLSHKFSLSGDESAKAADYDRQDKQGQSVEEKSHGNSEGSNDNNQFHFSIYKWASKGVMLMMPTRRGNRSNAKEQSKIIPAPVEQGVNLPSLDNTTSTANNSYRFQCGSQDDDSSNGLNIVRTNKENQEAVPAEAGARPFSSHDGDSTARSEQVNKVQSCGQDVHMGAKKEVQGPELKSLSSSNSAETEIHKTQLKTLGFLLMCSSDEPGKENFVESTGQQDDFPRLKNLSVENAEGSGKEKKPIGRKSVPKPIGRKPDLVHAETTNPNLHNAPVNSDNDMQGNRTKGKVREFVKIFNQESSQKLTCDFDTRSHSSRRKELGLSKKEDPVSVCTTKVDRWEKMKNEDNSGILTDTPSMVDQIPKQTAKIHPFVNADASKVWDSSSEKNGIADSSPDVLNDALENMEDSHSEDLHVSCLIEQLPEDEKENPHLTNQDDIRFIDAKIRQWSHAKEGNIRSLLSTLQYVLWADSGWKPVPLVDIIEGSAVRRAYQKALLCLHPDKLQQRGAAVHQKYIAEKVFGILQEAWTHFCSVSPI